MKKFYIVYPFGAVQKMFTNRGWKETHKMEDADLVQFTGGQDISPALYNQKTHPRTGSAAHRDGVEIEAFDKAAMLGKPMAGICRGAQLLHALNGGSLYQHVNNHCGPHPAVVLGKSDPIKVTSTHHQMMRWQDGHPSAILLMHSHPTGSVREYMDKDVITNDTELKEDVEAIYYPNTQCLCYQPHPEYQVDGGATSDTYFDFLDEHLGLRA